MTTTRPTTKHIDIALRAVTEFHAEEAAARMRELEAEGKAIAAEFDATNSNFWLTVNEHSAPAVAKAKQVMEAATRKVIS